MKQIHCLNPIFSEEMGTSQTKPSAAKLTRSLAGNSLQRYLVFPGKKIELYCHSLMEPLTINTEELHCSPTLCTTCPDTELEISILSFRCFSQDFNPFPLLEHISYCIRTVPFGTWFTLESVSITLYLTYLLDR